MENDVYSTGKQCCRLIQNKPVDKRCRLLQLFPSSNPLEFVVIETLRLILNSFHWNPIVQLLTNCHPKSMRAVTKFKKPVGPLMSSIMENWTLPYETLTQELNDNRMLFTIKLFEASCPFPHTKNLPNTMNQLQTNVLAERLNISIRRRLQHNVADDQR